MIIEPLPWCDPVEAAARMRPAGGLAFLDSAMPRAGVGRFSTVAADPFGVFTVEGGRARWNGEPLEGAPLAALKRLLGAFATEAVPGLPPFQGGAVGAIGYDFGRALLGLPAMPPPPWGAFPDVMLPFYDTVLAFDHAARAVWLIATGHPAEGEPARQERARRRAAAVRQRLAAALPAMPPAGPIGREAWVSTFTAGRYRDAVAATIDAILAGEIFQANIAQRFLAPLPRGFEPFAFYRQLRATNPAPFCAYLDQGRRVIASSSPELFATVADGVVETRPIKGTAPRGDTSASDRAAAERLAASEKDRAENLMIVDLLRNDLSRVCAAPSVDTPLLCGVESYAGLHHLVSAVTGRLAPGRDAVDLIAAAFPGGSVTGAPKHQAMQVIARTEGEARGIYCGSIAALGFSGALSASIAIRTVTLQGGVAAFGAGGGITAASDPAAEYQETLDKAERIFRGFEAGASAQAVAA